MTAVVLVGLILFFKLICLHKQIPDLTNRLLSILKNAGLLLERWAIVCTGLSGRVYQIMDGEHRLPFRNKTRSNSGYDQHPLMTS